MFARSRIFFISISAIPVMAESYHRRRFTCDSRESRPKRAYEARSINVAAAIRLDVIIISTHEQVARTVTFEPMARGTDLQVRPHLFATLHADAPVDRCIEYT